MRPPSETLFTGPSPFDKVIESAEVAMSIATGTVASSRRLFESPPVSIWVPLLVMVWVFVNVFLVRLGFRTGYQATCGLLAGGFDGSLLASIVLATRGDKIQAGTTAPPIGYAFHDALSNFALPI